MMLVELKVPKKWQKYFGKLEINPEYLDYGADEGKYILYYADGYAYMGEYPIMFLRSKKQVLEYLRYAEKEKYVKE